MKTVVFASRNRGKIIEVSEILGKADIKVVSLLGLDYIPEIIESGSTFQENAKIKAQAIFNELKIPVIADDSGLAVEQLGGRPGVYSARYAGEKATDKENNQKLINELMNFPEPHHAKFICNAVYLNGRNFAVATGEIAGVIILSPRGNSGFGYDPLFIPDGYDVTMAELSSEVKNKISHRFIAFDKLKELIN